MRRHYDAIDKENVKKCPAGGLRLLIDVCHGIAVASQAPNRQHTLLIVRIGILKHVFLRLQIDFSRDMTCGSLTQHLGDSYCSRSRHGTAHHNSGVIQHLSHGISVPIVRGMFG